MKLLRSLFILAIAMTAAGTARAQQSEDISRLGRHDTIQGGVIAGWSLDATRPWENAEISIYENFEPIYHGQADGPRPDVNAAYKVGWNHGFTVPMPAASCPVPRVRTFIVMVKDTAKKQWYYLHDTFRSLLCWDNPKLPVISASIKMGDQGYDRLRHGGSLEYHPITLNRFDEESGVYVPYIGQDETTGNGLAIDGELRYWQDSPGKIPTGSYMLSIIVDGFDTKRVYFDYEEGIPVMLGTIELKRKAVSIEFAEEGVTIMNGRITFTVNVSSVTDGPFQLQLFIYGPTAVESYDFVTLAPVRVSQSFKGKVELTGDFPPDYPIGSYSGAWVEARPVGNPWVLLGRGALSTISLRGKGK